MMCAKVRNASALCLFIASFMLHSPRGALSHTPSQTSPAQPATQTGAGEDERGTIKAKEFLGSRPGSNSPHPGRYRSRQRVPQGRTYTAVGVTVGRGRAATEAESKDRKVAKVRSADGGEHVLERISDNATVTDGTLMQMIIEYLAHHDASGATLSNRVGYLYVLNREQYPDGKYSLPKLIFPTKLTYGGDSRVLPGKIVTLPVPDRVWKVSRSASGVTQAFETYTIIISPKPLRDLSGRELQGGNLGEGSLRLDEKLVARWMRLWGGGEWRGDLENGVGQLITQREQNASGNPARAERTTDEESSDLKKDEAPPQIVFRRVLRPGGTMLVTIKLPFKDSAATKGQTQ